MTRGSSIPSRRKPHSRATSHQSQQLRRRDSGTPIVQEQPKTPPKPSPSLHAVLEPSPTAKLVERCRDGCRIGGSGFCLGFCHGTWLSPHQPCEPSSIFLYFRSIFTTQQAALYLWHADADCHAYSITVRVLSVSCAYFMVFQPPRLWDHGIGRAETGRIGVSAAPGPLSTLTNVTAEGGD